MKMLIIHLKKFKNSSDIFPIKILNYKHLINKRRINYESFFPFFCWDVAIMILSKHNWKKEEEVNIIYSFFFFFFAEKEKL